MQHQYVTLDFPTTPGVEFDVNDRQSLTVIITPAPCGTGRYEACLDGDDHVLSVSQTPFFDAARKLISQGYDPDTTLILRHAGSETDSLRAELGTAASLTVEETAYGPRVRRWKPISTLAVRAGIASANRTAFLALDPTKRQRRVGT